MTAPVATLTAVQPPFSARPLWGCRTFAPPFTGLFRFGPYHGFLTVNFDVDHVCSATNRTVFNVFLTRTLRYVQRNDYLLPASIADVAGFIEHHGCPQRERNPPATQYLSKEG